MEEWFLSLTKETKLKMLKDSETFSEFLTLAKILLDASMGRGGIQTHEIRIIATEKGYDDYKY